MKQVVDTGGLMTIGSGSGAPSSYFAGAEITNTSLSRQTKTITGQAIGDVYEQTDVTGRTFTISCEVYVKTNDTSAFFGIGNTAYAVYKTQTDTPTTLFAGAVIISQVGDRQAFGDYEKQTIELRSNGAPDTVAA